MIQTIELAYILFCIWLADMNADRIGEDKRINHNLQGAIHLISGVVFSILFNWWMMAVVLLSARIFFTSALNLFRHLPVDYVTTRPKAITDKIEQRIFGRNGAAPLMIYVLCWLIVNIIIAFK